MEASTSRFRQVLGEQLAESLCTSPVAAHGTPNSRSRPVSGRRRAPGALCRCGDPRAAPAGVAPEAAQ